MLSLSEEDLVAVGEQIGRAIDVYALPHIIALVGELGAGKTTLTRGIVQGLGSTTPATSPTFVLAKRYPAPKNRSIWHVDAYRLRDEGDLESIDFPGMIGSPRNVVIVEWADKIRGAVPEHAVWLHLRHTEEGREIEGLEAYGIEEAKTG